MIPSPLEDINLLLEHLYQENILANLHFVLNPAKFTSFGGFKPIREYGLGYFNYEIRLKDNIYTPTVFSQMGYSIFTYFELFFILYIVVLVYSLVAIVKIDNTSVLDHVLYLLKHKKLMMSKSTRLLDLQEKGEFHNKRGVKDEGLERNSGKEIEENRDGSAPENSTLHIRANNNNLEYNHIKL